MGVDKNCGISIIIASSMLHFVVVENHVLLDEVFTTKKYLHPIFMVVDKNSE